MNTIYNFFFRLSNIPESVQSKLLYSLAIFVGLWLIKFVIFKFIDAKTGNTLTVRFLCEPRQRRGFEEGIWEEILIAFGKNQDIEFAYPTQRFYNSLTEGKKDKNQGEG